MTNDSDSLPIAFTDPLATLLESRFVKWRDARAGQHQKMLECYQDVMRIPRDDDTKGSGVAKSKKAKGLFIGSTRNKVRSAKAKINDSLFGVGAMPFDTSPTNEELKEFSDTIEAILIQQLEDMSYKRMIKDGVYTLCSFGTGVTFGPFVKKASIKEVQRVMDKQTGIPSLEERVFEYDAPYFELAPAMDVVPDPDAVDAQDGMGIFWHTMMSPTKVAEWKNDPRYKNVDEALKCITKNDQDFGFDVAKALRGNIDLWRNEKEIRVVRYFGLVPRSSIAKQEGIEHENLDDDYDDLVEALVVMAGGVVVKADESPYQRRPAQRAVYEEVPHEWDGVGIAENNAPHQKSVNAAFRLFQEGKAMALLPPRAVDRSLFEPTEDFKIYPGKVYKFKKGLTPEQKKQAIMDLPVVDVTNGWLSLIEMSERFSDDDTGISKYTQGNDSKSLNDTATGISMIMNAASLPLKDVLQNIDEMWIEEHLESLIEWDLEYLEPEVVAKIHGEEVAARWKQIKEFGKSSFMKWKATGASTFVAKEVLMQKLQGFLALATGNPITADMVDVRELLEQVWDAAQVGKESPVFDDETLKERMAQKTQPAVDPMAGMALLMKVMPKDSPLGDLIAHKMAEQLGLADDNTLAALAARMEMHDAELEKKEKEVDKLTAQVAELVQQLQPHAMGMQAHG